MNSVLIFTDTQCQRMVGAYGQPVFDTPNLDRLAGQGVRFERAYTTYPVCTPARGALYTGQYPARNGAWANDLPVYRHLPMMGEIFRQAGVRAALTGKWHLDGAGYNGTGIPDGGFEPEWWFDRANLLAELYDLETDPYELTNRIDVPASASVRDALHDRLLAELEQWHDPMRNWLFGDRPWRKVRSLFYIQQPEP
ncbi:sulfatase-like hydrolase/transferase [bacterium]|nr:sulfatase-like hydrolase/transferase [bacterium]